MVTRSSWLLWVATEELFEAAGCSGSASARASESSWLLEMGIDRPFRAAGCSGLAIARLRRAAGCSKWLSMGCLEQLAALVRLSRGVRRAAGCSEWSSYGHSEQLAALVRLSRALERAAGCSECSSYGHSEQLAARAWRSRGFGGQLAALVSLFFATGETSDRSVDMPSGLFKKRARLLRQFVQRDRERMLPRRKAPAASLDGDRLSHSRALRYQGLKQY